MGRPVPVNTSSPAGRWTQPRIASHDQGGLNPLLAWGDRGQQILLVVAGGLVGLSLGLYGLQPDGAPELALLGWSLVGIAIYALVSTEGLRALHTAGAGPQLATLVSMGSGAAGLILVAIGVILAMLAIVILLVVLAGLAAASDS